MTGSDEIGGGIHSISATRPADPLPTAAGLDHFSASENYAAREATKRDRLASADPFISFHGAD